MSAEVQPIECASATRNYSGWLSKSFWAILDQGLFSISNFAASILLANKLEPRDYGAFSVAFSYFLGFAIFHVAFLTEPALVFGSGKYRSQLKSYLGALLYGHGLISAVGMLVLFAAGKVYYFYATDPAAGTAMMAFSLAAPLLLLLWLMRRTCYVDSKPQRAAAGDGAYLVLMLAGLLVLDETGHLSIITAIAVMAACSLAASILLLIREQPRFVRDEIQLFSSVLGDHWTYGRWAAITGVATFIPNQIFFLLLESTTGLAAAGMLRAYSNLVMPFLQANLAMGMLIIPMLARSRGTPRFNRIVLVSLAALCGGPMLLALILGTFPSQALNLLYNGKYQVDTNLMWVIAIHPVVAGAFVVFHTALQSYQKPKYVFYASAAAAAATLVVGWPATHAYGVTGAAVGMAVGFTVNALVSAFFYWKVILHRGSSLFSRKDAERATLLRDSK